MSCGETYDLAEKLLIHLAEDVGGQDGEFVGAFRIIEPVDDVFKRLVVYGDVRGELVCLFRSCRPSVPGMSPAYESA